MEAQGNKTREKLDAIKGIEIRCFKCNKIIGKIQNGSLISKGVSYICYLCRSKLEKTQREDSFGFFGMKNPF